MELNNEQDAIKQAVEAGFGSQQTVHDALKDFHFTNTVLQDSAFWQALGKARGWKKDPNYRTHRIGSHSDDWGGTSDAPCDCNKPKDWKDYAHQWLETRLSNGDLEKYWQSLP